MKMSSLSEGSCYQLDFQIEKLGFIKSEIDHSNLLENKGRPYMLVMKDVKNNLVWLAPITSNAEKYKKYMNAEIQKYGKAKSYIIFHNWQKENAIVLSNAFPVLPSYVRASFVNKEGRTIPLHSSVQHKAKELLKDKINLNYKGKHTFWANVNEIKRQFRRIDYRCFKNLTDVEQQKVVYHTYKSYLDSFKTVEGYTEALRKVLQTLQTRKDILFNPHTCQKRVVANCKLGLPYEEIKKGNPFFQKFSSHETIAIAKELQKQDIPFSAVVKQDGKGIITIDKKNLSKLNRISREYINKTKNINRNFQFDSTKPDLYKKVACMRNEASMICSRFDVLSIPYDCNFYDDKTAEITIYSSDVKQACKVMRQFDVYAPIRNLHPVIPQNSVAMTL